MDNWDPIFEDYQNAESNRYHRGPGCRLQNIRPSNTDKYKYGDAIPTCLYVKGIPSNVRQNGLLRLFAQYGCPQKAIIIPSKDPRFNYGIVEYDYRGEAEEARCNLDGLKINDVTLHVSYYVKNERPRDDIRDSVAYSRSQPSRPGYPYVDYEDPWMCAASYAPYREHVVAEQKRSGLPSSRERHEIRKKMSQTRSNRPSHYLPTCERQEASSLFDRKNAYFAENPGSGRLLPSQEVGKSMQYTVNNPEEILESVSLQDRICGNCQKRDSSFRCTGCAKMVYCSAECQLTDWHDKHELVCSPYSSSVDGNQAATSVPQGIVPVQESNLSYAKSNTSNEHNYSNVNSQQHNLKKSENDFHMNQNDHQNFGSNQMNYGQQRRDICSMGNSRNQSRISPVYREIESVTNFHQTNNEENRTKYSLSNNFNMNCHGISEKAPICENLERNDIEKSEFFPCINSRFKEDFYQSDMDGKNIPSQKSYSPKQQDSVNQHHSTPKSHHVSVQVSTKENLTGNKMDKLDPPPQVNRNFKNNFGQSSVNNGRNKMHKKSDSPKQDSFNGQHATRKFHEVSVQTPTQGNFGKVERENFDSLPHVSTNLKKDTNQFDKNNRRNDSYKKSFDDPKHSVNKQHSSSQVTSVSQGNTQKQTISLGGNSKDVSQQKKENSTFKGDIPKKDSVGVADKPQSINLPGTKEPQLTSKICTSTNSIYTEADLKEMRFSTGGFVQVMYCFGFSWDELYVNLCRNYVIIERLAVLLKDHCDSIGTCNSIIPSVGQIYAANWQGDWYRAKISEIDGSVIKVQFIDYGNSDVTTVNNLKLLNSELMQIPPQALRCKLHGIEPIDDKWSKGAIELLENICTTEFYIKIIEQSKINMVEIFLNEDGVSVNMQLVKKGIAKKISVVDQLGDHIDTACSSEKYSVNLDVATANQEIGEAVQKPEPNSSVNLDVATANQEFEEAVQTLEPDSCDNIEELKSILATLDVGKNVNLIMMVDNEKEYWALLQQTGLNFIFEEQSKIKATYDNVPASNYSPVKGEIVAARSNVHGEWYRARIHKVLPKSYIVFYIDFGNFEEIEIVRKLEKEFKIRPSCAVRCCLTEQSNAAKCDLGQTETYFGVVTSKTNDNVIIACDLDQKITCDVMCYSDFLQISDLVDADFEIDREYEVLVTSINDLQGIYFIKSDDLGILATVTQEYNAYCTSLEEKSYNAIFEEIVFANYEGDWYRGHVISITDGGAYKVQYIDFGNVSEVKIEEIRRMPRKYAKLPKISSCGSLRNVNILNITPEMELLIYGQKKVKVVKKVDELLIIQMWDADGKLVADKLQDSNLKTENQNATNIEEICTNLDEKLSLDRSEKVLPDTESLAASSMEDQSSKVNPTSKIPPLEVIDSSQEVQPSTQMTSCETVNSYCDSAGTSHQSSGKKLERLYMYSDCTHALPEVGDEMNYVVLAMMSPEIVNCGSLTDEDVSKMNELSEKLTEECNNSTNRYGYHPLTGELCLAKYSEDELWYRATAIMPRKDEWLLLFVDYGNFETVQPCNIRKITEYYANIPILVFSCKLHGVEPIDGESWPADVDKSLAKIFEFPLNQHGKVVDFDQNKNIFIIDFPEIKEKIVEAGLAKPSI